MSTTTSRWLLPWHWLTVLSAGANLLVDGTGQTLKIADFGAATRMSFSFERPDAHGYNNSIAYSSVPGEFKGQMQGTIAFTAPEVLRGEDYGRSSDVWSVGCCVVEMITTRPPWNIAHFENEYSLLYKVWTARNHHMHMILYYMFSVCILDCAQWGAAAASAVRERSPSRASIGMSSSTSGR